MYIDIAHVTCTKFAHLRYSFCVLYGMVTVYVSFYIAAVSFQSHFLSLLWNTVMKVYVSFNRFPQTGLESYVGKNVRTQSKSISKTEECCHRCLVNH